MSLASDFRFGQGSLQDYIECPRRFQLRYVHRLRWPAVEVSPPLERERSLQQGAAFHRLIHQHLIGFPVKRLSGTVTDRQLRRWWCNYLEAGLADLPPSRYPEIGLAAPVGRYRLVAQYDLLAIEAGVRSVIVDWKTSRRRPSRSTLLDSLQTRVYAYLLVRAGAVLNGGERIRPQQVTMVYWFANYPTRSEWYSYAEDRYRADHEFLTGLIGEIETRLDETDEGDLLPATDHRRRCRYCRYRSLCQRGVEAGLLDGVGQEFSREDGADREFDFDFDFEQVAEADYG